MGETRNIEVSNEIHERLKCFKRVVDAILKEKMSFPEYAELVLSRGMASMLRDVIPSDDPEILMQSMEQIFQTYPDPISRFIVETLKKGEESQLRERWGLE